ncbi:unnamed protein product [Mucor hiemalis]
MEHCKTNLLYIATTPIAAEEVVAVDNDGKPDDGLILNDIITKEAIVKSNFNTVVIGANVVKDSNTIKGDIAVEDGISVSGGMEDDYAAENPVEDGVAAANAMNDCMPIASWDIMPLLMIASLMKMKVTIPLSKTCKRTKRERQKCIVQR